MRFLRGNLILDKRQLSACRARVTSELASGKRSTRIRNRGRENSRVSLSARSFLFVSLPFAKRCYCQGRAHDGRARNLHSRVPIYSNVLLYIRTPRRYYLLFGCARHASIAVTWGARVSLRPKLDRTKCVCPNFFFTQTFFDGQLKKPLAKARS